MEETRPLLATNFGVENLCALRWALDQHNGTCGVPATAFLLNPVDHGLLRFDELWGLPVRADERVPVKSFRLACTAKAWCLEDELEYLAAEHAGREDPPDA